MSALTPASNATPEAREARGFTGLDLVSWALGSLLLWAVWSARMAGDPGLIGEELALGYRAPVYFAHHLVADSYATTYSVHAFYAAVNALFPVGLHSTRLWSLLVCSFAFPLLSRFARELAPGAGIVAPLAAVLVLASCPPFAWLATGQIDMAGTVTLGLALLLSPVSHPFVRAGRVQPAAVVAWVLLAVVALHWYGAAMVLVAASAVGHATTTLRERPGGRGVALLAAVGAATLALAAWPWLYYTEVSGFTGGGQALVASGAALAAAVEALADDLFLHGRSYLLSWPVPAGAFDLRYAGAAVLALAAAGAWRCRRHPLLPGIALAALASAAQAVLVWPLPGLRRGLILVALVALVAGVELDARLRRTRPALAALALGLLLLFQFAPFGRLLSHLRHDHIAWLQRDLRVPFGPRHYEPALETLVLTLREQPLVAEALPLDYALLVKGVCRSRGPCHPLTVPGLEAPAPILAWLATGPGDPP
ncbi:MAG: hypothetical protein NDJ94_06760 [Vicinamibacteria bacterium]|nr:hypothetical protein [Vicinamibacteria bacterium]